MMKKIALGVLLTLLYLLLDVAAFGEGEVIVAPASLDHFSITAPGEVTAGEAFPVTITARDSFGNIVSDYRLSGKGEVKEKGIEDYYRMGKKYYCAANYQKAIREFEKVLEIDPLHKKARKYLIKSHYEIGEKFYRNQAYRQASIEFGKVLAREPEHKKAKEYLSECQTRVRVEVAKEVPEEKGVKPIEEGPPEKIMLAKEVPIEEEIKEGLEVIPTPLPPKAKVIHSADVISGVKAEMVGEKTKVTITLSGERKYTASERSQPPAIVIDIPHTINAIFPERIMVNQGCVRTIEVTQHRALPFDETRIVINLSRFKEYEVKSRENEIYVEFEE